MKSLLGDIIPIDVKLNKIKEKRKLSKYIIDEYEKYLAKNLKNGLNSIEGTYAKDLIIELYNYFTYTKQIYLLLGIELNYKHIDMFKKHFHAIMCRTIYKYRNGYQLCENIKKKFKIEFKTLI